MAISINRTRNLVMYLLAKNNKGHITPMAFDAFADLAQKDILESLFYKHNKWLNYKNKRLSNTEFADIAKNIQEQIDIFSTYSLNSNFTYNDTDNVWSYTGTDLYRTLGLELKNAQGKGVEIEEVSKGAELTQLVNSKVNAPTVVHPIYVKVGEGYRVFPIAPAGYKAELLYLRTPKSPKWPYVMVSGNPVYDGSSSELQDIELGESMFAILVSKILAYCGLSIKEEDIVTVADADEQQIESKQQ